jgi:hypothetical protein
MEKGDVRAVVGEAGKRLDFPAKHRFQIEMMSGFEDVGLLHWLSHVVWGGTLQQQAKYPVELVRLQVAMELFKQELIPPKQSFLSLVVEQQKPLNAELASGKELNEESLATSGFCIVRGFLSKKLCKEDALSELRKRVLECKKREAIFQAPFRNDGYRVQASIGAMKAEGGLGQPLQVLPDAVTKKLGSLIPSRSGSDMVAVLALAGCGPQRPHADYTRQSLDGIEDDGFCGGLPLGVVIALEPNTYFDVWPGAVNWDDSRFFEHRQFILETGDAVFFLGNAIHAGAAFEQANVRLHCYLDRPGVQREPDTTCFMDIAAGVGNVLPRGVKLPFLHSEKYWPFLKSCQSTCLLRRCIRTGTHQGTLVFTGCFFFRAWNANQISHRCGATRQRIPSEARILMARVVDAYLAAEVSWKR